MRIPRKKKKKIPTGMYCYTITSDFKQFKDGSYGYTVKVCPFYTSGWCNLIKGEVLDQCKSCSLKYGLK